MPDMPHTPPDATRRDFLRASTATVVGGSVAGLAASNVAAVASMAHAGGRNELRVGLVGCGGRGSGAAVNALRAEPTARLVAMADAFPDRLESSLSNLRASQVGSQIAVKDDHKFAGFDGYKDVIAASDVVLLCATPHFRPRHIEAAVAAGKHIFAEKPVAIDPVGVRRVMNAVAEARKKDLNLVSGLCYRYHSPKQELIRRVHDGQIGDIVALECTYNAQGLWHRGRQPGWSDMEWQIRNWLYFTWLSGDHIVEQSVHSIDKILWAMGDKAPARVTASGGRSARVEAKYGNIFDHFNSVFEWENGPKLFHSCRQIVNGDTNVSDFVYGSKGTAGIQHHHISGENEWRWAGPANDMYQAEHDALFGSIRNGEVVNNGDYMCKATLMGIMARMAAYTGKTITWEQAMNSKLDLTPSKYAWGDNPVAAVAVPGKTPLV